MTYYIGNETSIADLLGADNPRYFYALRRDEDGLLFFAKIDQLKDTSAITVNIPGPNTQNYEDFEYGVDFFDGRLEEDHSRPYANLYWDQYRWDSKNCYYYLDTLGNIIVRINQSYSYPPELIVTP